MRTLSRGVRMFAGSSCSTNGSAGNREATASSKPSSSSAVRRSQATCDHYGPVHRAHGCLCIPLGSLSARDWRRRHRRQPAVSGIAVAHGWQPRNLGYRGCRPRTVLPARPAVLQIRGAGRSPGWESFLRAELRPCRRRADSSQARCRRGCRFMSGIMPGNACVRLCSSGGRVRERAIVARARHQSLAPAGAGIPVCDDIRPCPCGPAAASRRVMTLVIAGRRHRLLPAAPPGGQAGAVPGDGPGYRQERGRILMTSIASTGTVPGVQLPEGWVAGTWTVDPATAWWASRCAT
jgi:hypothetical protein